MVLTDPLPKREGQVSSPECVAGEFRLLLASLGSHQVRVNLLGLVKRVDQEFIYFFFNHFLIHNFELNPETIAKLVHLAL